MSLPLSVLEELLDANPLATIYADKEGLIQYWNQAATGLLGFTPEQVLGQSLDLIIPEKLRAPHWKGFDRAMETGVTRLGGKFVRTKATTSTGESCYAEVCFSLIKDEEGKVIGSVAYARATD